MPPSVNVWVGLISAILSVLFVPLIAFITARRSTSGRVNTSDAKDLWEESRSIRQELRKELEKQNTALSNAQRENAELHARLLQLQEDQEQSRIEARHNRDEVAANRVTIANSQSHIILLTKLLRENGISVPDAALFPVEQGILPASGHTPGG